MTVIHLGHVGSARAFAGVAPLRPYFTCADEIDLCAELGAKPAPNRRYRRSSNALVVALLLTGWSDPHRWIAYSRDASRYSALRRYFGPAMSLPAIIWTVETLETAALIDHRKTRPSATARYRSTLRATCDLIDRSPITSLEHLRAVPSEPIRLKDAAKRLRRYRETSSTRGWRWDVDAQNEALQAVSLTMPAARWRLTERGLWTNGSQSLNPARDTYYRVFNKTWGHGGRWYGPFWQSLPSSARAELHIDGEPVVEIDYRALHPRLLAAEAGVTLGDADPYEIEGWCRQDVKRAFNILLNANSRLAAIRAVQANLQADNHSSTFEKAKRLVQAVDHRHPNFLDAWGTGKGLRLQAIDAEICACVQSMMREHGQPVLSVHDSFIAPASKKLALEAAMDDALTGTLKALAAQR